MAAFSASLISSLAIQRRHLPFRDLQGLLHDGSYRLGVIDNSSNMDIFKVWSRHTSDYWLLQLHNLQLNGIRITRFNFWLSALCLTECMYVCMYVCLFVLSPRGRIPNGNSILMEENRGLALLHCHWLFGRLSSESLYSRGGVWVQVLQYQRPVVML
jgi:hypothetical protein